MTIDSTEAIIDGVRVEMEQAPFIVPESNRTVIPLRFVMEELGKEVVWNEQDRTIEIIDA